MIDSISIVIPCYNSENTIGAVVDEITATMNNELKYEIILVNDGSSKKLWDILKSIADKYPKKVRCIGFAKNFGQHSALMAGYRESKGDIIIQMDDDGQCNPKAIFTLLNKIEEGYDAVFAKYPNAQKSTFRKWGSEINRRMCVSLIDMPANLHPMSFSAFRRYLVEEMIRYDKPYPYIAGLVFRSTSNVCDVEIEHRPRIVGESNYNIGKLLKLWFNGFTAFSVKPLEIAAIIGVLIAALGMLYSIYIIVKRIFGFPYLEGWSSLIALTLLLDGFLLVMIGLVGEYVGRVYICLNNAPQYVIKDVYGETEF